MNEDEQMIWGRPVSFQDFVQGFQATPNQRKVEFIPKADPQKFYIREKVASPSQNQGEIRDANKERVNKSLSNYASNNFLLSTSNIRPDQNGRYNPGLGQFAGDQTALTLSMGFDPFNGSNYYKVATQIPKFRNWGLTRLLANELNNEVRVAEELGKLGTKTTLNPIVRTKIGDIEINNPELYYHQSGPSKAKNFITTQRMRTLQEEYWLKQEHVPIQLRTGAKPGFPQSPGRAMFSQGKLWYGLNPEQFPDLLVTAKEMPIANSKAGVVKGPLSKLEAQGSRRVTNDNFYKIGPHTTDNTSAYTYIPGYGYKQITQEPRTSLKFFERPQSKINEAEKAGVPKGERNLKTHGQFQAPYYDYSLINRNYEPWKINEKGQFVFESPEVSKKLGTVHFTFNSPVTAHSGGSWDSAPTTILLPYRNIRSQVSPVDVAIYDTFFPNYNGLKFSSRGSKALTGDRATFDYYKSKGLNVEFSPEIEAKIKELKIIEDQLNKLPNKQRYSVVGQYPEVDKLRDSKLSISDDIDKISRDWTLKHRKPIPDYEHVQELGKVEGYDVENYPYQFATPARLVGYDIKGNPLYDNVKEGLDYSWHTDPSNHAAILELPEYLLEKYEGSDLRPEYIKYLKYLVNHKADFRKLRGGKIIQRFKNRSK